MHILVGLYAKASHSNKSIILVFFLASLRIKDNLVLVLGLKLYKLV